MTSSRTRRAGAVVLVAVALVGLRAAYAASPGTGDDLVLAGADGAAACGGSGVDVDYDVAWVEAIGGYGVTGARLSGLDARCAGHDAVVSLTDAGGGRLVELTGPVAGGDLRLALPAGVAVAADDVAGVAVVLRAARG